MAEAQEAPEDALENGGLPCRGAAAIQGLQAGAGHDKQGVCGFPRCPQSPGCCSSEGHTVGDKPGEQEAGPAGGGATDPRKLGDKAPPWASPQSCPLAPG